MDVKVKTNWEKEDGLYCMECKQKIHISERYCILLEQLYSGEIYKKILHPECLPEITEEDYYEDTEQE
jgi:hypothetical protein